jgi:hypothetical protein
MMQPSDPSRTTHLDGCAPIPPFERVSYFYGQLLGVREFQAEQSFFRDKLKLHNRYLHGWGTVCGLTVAPCPPEPDPCPPPPPPPPPPGDASRADFFSKKAAEAMDPNERAEYEAAAAALRREERSAPTDPCGEPRPSLCVIVECGLGLDCHGNELVVRAPTRIDLLRRLDAKDWALYVAGGRKLYLSLCFDETPVDPVRPLQTDACAGAPSDCTHARLRDSVCFRVSVDPPPHAHGCTPCDGACRAPWLLLAVIDPPAPGQPLTPAAIHGDVQRLIAPPYDTTRIVGVSWQHGAAYTREEAFTMLDAGLEVRFSRGVHAETLHDRAIFDLYGIEGGRGRSSQVFHVEGAYVDLPKSGLVTSVKLRQSDGEYFQTGDRVVVTLRCDFILDECCRAVDGEHVGGRVPILPEYEPTWGRHHHGEWPCPQPPGHHGPWRSGTGTPGGTFESWFYIKNGKVAK